MIKLMMSPIILNVSLNFILCDKVEKVEASDFFREKLGQ